VLTSKQWQKDSKIRRLDMRESFLEIDSQRLRHNLKVFKKKLSPGTQILANLKANAYGIGAFEIGQILEQAGVSYFSVAFINEGVFLRKNGIKTNLLVFNPSFDHFQELIDYRLEPEASSIPYLEVLKNYLDSKKIKNFPVHLKLDTGMHRAGMMPEELTALINLLKNQNTIQVKSVFSHLAAAEDPDEDNFTGHQIHLFEQMSSQLRKELSYNFFRHLLNNAHLYYWVKIAQHYNFGVFVVFWHYWIKICKHI
jgi:alanine racemase